MKPADLFPLIATAAALPQGIPDLKFFESDSLDQSNWNFATYPLRPHSYDIRVPLRPQELNHDIAVPIQTLEELDEFTDYFKGFIVLEDVPALEAGGNETLAVLVRTEREMEFSPGNYEVRSTHIGTVVEGELKDKLHKLRESDNVAEGLAYAMGRDGGHVPGSSDSVVVGAGGLFSEASEGLSGQKCIKKKCAIRTQCGKGCHVCYPIHCH